VLGATGDDGLAGGPGADMLDGGPGDDLLAGGPGPDRFALSPGDDRITDFDPGADTVIVPANAPPSAITTGATPAGNARVDGAAADSGTLTLVGIAPSELDTDAFPGL
jgi:Ca2+-binding RTX toxin-like protein